MTNQEKTDKGIPINFPDDLKGGVYSNNMTVQHSRDEFLMDFMMVAPPAGAVTARIIVGPGHMKRIANAIQENIRKYESKYGTIKETKAPIADIGPIKATA